MAYRRILTLARFTLLEAWRTRLPGLFLIALALACGTAYFFQQLAITESVRLQIIFSAAASGCSVCAWALYTHQHRARIQ